MEPHKQTAITFCTQPAGSSAAAPAPPPPATSADASTVSQLKHESEAGAAAEPESLSMLAWHATQSLTVGHLHAPSRLGSNAGQLQAPPPVDNNDSSRKGSTPAVPAAAGGNGNDSSSSAAGSSTTAKSLTADLLMLAVGNSRQMGRRVKVRAVALTAALHHVLMPTLSVACRSCITQQACVLDIKTASSASGSISTTCVTAVLTTHVRACCAPCMVSCCRGVEVRKHTIADALCIIQFLPCLQVCPDALLDDGLLDFTLWTGESITSEVRQAAAAAGWPVT
jgi:hypothetical protein